MTAMLAHCYNPDKHEKTVDGWWMSIKYDGVRAIWDGKEMKSRTGKTYTIPTFLSDQLSNVLDDEGNPMKLDGELWAGNDTFAFMSGLARKHDNDEKLWQQVNYMIFDTPDTDMKFEDRIRKVQTAIKKAKLKNAKGVKYHRINLAETNVMRELVIVEKDGGEGLILRKPGSLYTFARSHDMLKVKSWSYNEAIVVGYVEGTGKYTGMVGSLAVKSNKFEEEIDANEDPKWVSFKVGSGLNDWQRHCGVENTNWKSKEIQMSIDNERKKLVKDYTDDKDIYDEIVDNIKNKTGKLMFDSLHELNTLFPQMPLIGDTITFRYKELTKDGNPSMPTFVGVRNYE
jgi:DNA ligase-1